MSTKTPRFTSEADYDQYSFNLSKQLKSIKLNALRTAMAKADGFDRQESYRAFLRKSGQKASSDLNSFYRSPFRRRTIVYADGQVFKFIDPEVLQAAGLSEDILSGDMSFIKDGFRGFAGGVKARLFYYYSEPSVIVIYEGKLYLEVYSTEEGLTPEEADDSCIHDMGRTLCAEFGGYYGMFHDAGTNHFQFLIPMDYLYAHESTVDEISQKISDLSDQVMLRHRLELCIRTKGLIDGCFSLKEAAAKCRDKADSIDSLAQAGAAITDDQGEDGSIFVVADNKALAQKYRAAYESSPKTHEKAFWESPQPVKAGPESGRYELCLRAKWLVAGQGSLIKIAANIRGFADYLEKLASAGLEISEPSYDDYVFLYTDDQEVAETLGMTSA